MQIKQPLLKQQPQWRWWYVWWRQQACSLQVRCPCAPAEYPRCTSTPCSSACCGTCCTSSCANDVLWRTRRWIYVYYDEWIGVWHWICNRSPCSRSNRWFSDRRFFGPCFCCSCRAGCPGARQERVLFFPARLHQVLTVGKCCKAL